MNKNNTLIVRISEDYLCDEEDKGNHIKEWIKSYCNRNHTPLITEKRTNWGYEFSKQLTFKSFHQMGYFQRHVNNN